MYKSEKTADMGPPNGQPSFCFIAHLFAESTDFLVNLVNNFQKMHYCIKFFNFVYVINCNCNVINCFTEWDAGEQ